MAAVSPTLPSVGITVAGAGGRMGRALIKGLQQAAGLQLRGALVSASSPLVGVDAGTLVGLKPLGISLTDQLPVALATADVLIDFTTPTATLQHLAYCCQQSKAMVIGTTGFAEDAREQIAHAANHIAVVVAANFSVGVNLLYRLLVTVAQTMGTQSDIDILECHHRHKKDIPSGSALAMGEVIAGVLGRSLSQCAYYAKPDLHAPREKMHIGFSSVRAGETIGEHRVTFNTGSEQLVLTHKANSRLTFAEGALLAARWISEKPAALYDLQEILRLSTNMS